jgi:6-phosphogluconolactonase (cycloisomerase 2 family)
MPRRASALSAEVPRWRSASDATFTERRCTKPRESDSDVGSTDSAVMQSIRKYMIPSSPDEDPLCRALYCRPDYEQTDELGVQVSGLGSMPMWLSVHPSGASAYTVDMSGEGSVHAHTVSPLSGALTPINSQPSRGAGPCHLTALENFVLCANYSGGTISVLPVDPNGGLGPAVEYKDHGTTIGSGAGVHVRQDMAHPHQILLDPSGKYCFVPDLGTNKVHSYLWNSDVGALTEASELLLHDGAGPRHMCFSPDGAHAYVLGELDNSVSVCTHVGGKLEVIQILNSLLPGTEHATAGGGAEIIISPNGRFVYATIRGTCAVIEDPYPTNYAFNVIGKCCAC